MEKGELTGASLAALINEKEGVYQGIENWNLYEQALSLYLQAEAQRESLEKDFEKYKSDKGLTYMYSHNYKGFVSNPLPSFWNSKVSKAYGNYKK